MLAAATAAVTNFLIASSLPQLAPCCRANNRINRRFVPASIMCRSCTKHVARPPVVIPRHCARWGQKGIMMRDRQLEQEANIAILIDADNATPEHLDEVL